MLKRFHNFKACLLTHIATCKRQTLISEFFQAPGKNGSDERKGRWGETESLGGDEMKREEESETWGDEESEKKREEEKERKTD